MEKKTKKPAVSNYKPEYTAIKKSDSYRIEEPSENLKTPQETIPNEKISNPFSKWMLPPQRTSYIKARACDCL